MRHIRIERPRSGPGFTSRSKNCGTRSYTPIEWCGDGGACPTNGTESDIGVEPPDAELSLDGKPFSKRETTHEVFVEPGQHTIRARLAGHTDAVHTFEALAGKNHEVSLQLPRSIEANGALRFPRSPELNSTSAPATAPSSETPAEPSPAAAAVRTTGLVLTGSAVVLGVSLLAWGAHTASDAQDRVTELQKKGWATNACLGPDAPVECQELASAHKRRAQLVEAGIASLAVGGGLAVLTAASYVLLTLDPAPDTGVRVVPLATAQAAGLSFHGSW
ncbi:MAG: hypothetical protein IT372_19320 [Polyangiaceae bacterium]|nr:hypothetical protein [Polyangiaceae bacterium]